MIEFIVGLVAILLVTAGLLTVGILAKGDTDAAVEAQEEAVEASMGSGFRDSFHPIGSIEAGPDGRFLTNDDEPRSGSLSPLRSSIASHVLPDGDASAFTRPDGEPVHHGEIIEVLSDVSPADAFAMQKGSASRTVELEPSADILLGLGTEAELRSEVWLPEVGGL